MDEEMGVLKYESGETARLCQSPGLNRFMARNSEEVVTWEFFQKPIYSQFHNNPKRGMDASLSGALDDAVKQV